MSEKNYTEAIKCLRQTLKEGAREQNVDIRMMLGNISRCQQIVQTLHKSSTNPLYQRALSSLNLSLAGHRAILSRKIQALSTIPSVSNTSKVCDLVLADGPGEVEHGERTARQRMIAETIVSGGQVSMHDVIGLEEAKQALQEAVVFPLLFPHLFLGGREPWKRVLLYGPPGTGKSHLAHSITSHIQSTFYSVSCADLMSSWVGESEKLIKELFSHASRQDGKSVIFIDEIDSICRRRCSKEDDHTRRVKTELLKQMDGCGITTPTSSVFLVCATNCPWELDSAFLRRFQKRIYIPLPDRSSRVKLMQQHIQTTVVRLQEKDWESLADKTDGYSGSDLAALTLDALFQPVRELQTATHWRCLSNSFYTPCSSEHHGAFLACLGDIPHDKVSPRDVELTDFLKSVTTHCPTVSAEELNRFINFLHHFDDKA